MLGIEEGTEFHRRRESLALPDEDEVGEMYLYACSLLEEKGFFQYEISNFSQKGAESRHNLKYWRCEEYLGIGPSAHSFIEGERFFYPRSLEDFMSGKEPAADGSGGDFEEYAMLAMRLKEGLSDAETLRRFGHPIPEEMKREAAELSRTGLLDFEGGRISLTAKGFLLSNQIIARLIFS